jgi:hypothetical protein
MSSETTRFEPQEKAIGESEGKPAPIPPPKPSEGNAAKIDVPDPARADNPQLAPVANPLAAAVLDIKAQPSPKEGVAGKLPEGEPVPVAKEGASGKPSGGEPVPVTKEGAADTGPSAKARQQMKDATSGYVGGGRAAAEANFYSGVGAVHLGSGSVNYNYYSATQPDGHTYSVERISAPHIDKVRAVYVAPQAQQYADQILAASRVLVLHGNEHRGKRTAAIHMLAARYGEELFEISPTVNFEEEKAFTIENKRGYFVDQLTPARAAMLHAYLLRRLSTQLAAQASHLIIILPAQEASVEALLGEYLAPWNDLPDCVAVLRKHLHRYVNNVALDVQAEILIMEADIQKALGKQPPHRIDYLATLLASVVRGEISKQTALETFNFNAARQVEQWFSMHPNLERRTLLLSAAIFHGGLYRHAVEADRRLREIIKEHLPKDAPMTSPSLFGNARTATMRDMLIHVESKPEQTDAGRSNVERIRLEHEMLQPAILRYSWREHDDMRDVILQWLEELGRSDDPDIRNRAAAAIGELSKEDFATMYQRFLKPREHDTSYSPVLAAVALGVLAAQKEFAAQTIELLHTWSNSDEDDEQNDALRWIAALAYGLRAGSEFPADALWDLHAIAQRKDWELLYMVSGSVIDLFLFGRTAPSYYFRVIESLDAWTAQSRSGMLVETWLRTFGLIAKEAKHPISKTVSYPTVLWIYGEFVAYRPRIRRLIHRALNLKVARDDTRDALRSWLRAADDRPALYPVVSQLVLDLAHEGQQHEQERVSYWIHRWAADAKQPSEAAERIGSLLAGVC